MAHLYHAKDFITSSLLFLKKWITHYNTHSFRRGQPPQQRMRGFQTPTYSSWGDGRALHTSNISGHHHPNLLSLQKLLLTTLDYVMPSSHSNRGHINIRAYLYNRHNISLSSPMCYICVSIFRCLCMHVCVCIHLI